MFAYQDKVLNQRYPLAYETFILQSIAKLCALSIFSIQISMTLSKIALRHFTHVGSQNVEKLLANLTVCSLEKGRRSDIA